MPAQKIPRIDPARMPILPVELDGVTADAVRACGLGRSGIHGQQGSRFGFRLASFAPLGIAFVDAGGAGARIAKPCEIPCASVPVLPVDLETGALGDLHAHLVWSDCDARERLLGIVVPGLLFFVNEAYAFVTHDSILVRRASS